MAGVTYVGHGFLLDEVGVLGPHGRGDPDVPDARQLVPVGQHGVEVVGDEADGVAEEDEELGGRRRQVEDAVVLPVELLVTLRWRIAGQPVPLCVDVVERTGHPRRVAPTGPGGQLPGEHGVHPVDILDVVATGRHDPERPVLAAVDEALVRESQQGLADRHRAHPEAAGHLLVGHDLAGFELTDQDHVPDDVGGLPTHVAPGDGARSGFDGWGRHHGSLERDLRSHIGVPGAEASPPARV
jgi:hypothetical protein